ncbi:hypothetical protein Tsubulata_009022 [Turnera subulata]|uniref:RING-type E3 ubiquitin transferase n=1 Tax=Turnera subulata TaxID=218843 RepID=A0A9Q0FIR0_9ROSI|nr:hypothetical protein Tsubulata_009022 [Turnera subulata]
MVSASSLIVIKFHFGCCVFPVLELHSDGKVSAASEPESSFADDFNGFINATPGHYYSNLGSDGRRYDGSEKPKVWRCIDIASIFVIPKAASVSVVPKATGEQSTRGGSTNGGGSSSANGGGGDPPVSYSSIQPGDIESVDNLQINVFNRRRELTYSGTIMKCSVTGRSHLFQWLGTRVWESVKEVDRVRAMERLRVESAGYNTIIPLAGNMSIAMTQEEIDILPEYEYKVPDSSASVVPHSSDASIALKCVVCQDQVKPGEIVRALPCLHQFHKVCVDGWLREKGQCPFCRRGARQGG